MAQVPGSPTGYPQQQQQQQQQLPGQQAYYAGGVPPPGLQVVGMPPAGMPPAGMPSAGTPGGMNMGTPGTLLPNGQFIPNGVGPAPVYSTGAPVFAPSPRVEGGGAVMAMANNTQEQQPQQYVGVPPGMTRESLQPGYDPRLKHQRRVFNPQWSFKDSFGNSRGKHCCTVS